MEPVPIKRFESGTGSINRFQIKTGLPALKKITFYFHFCANLIFMFEIDFLK